MSEAVVYGIQLENVLLIVYCSRHHISIFM